VGEIGPTLCQEYVKWGCAQRDKRAKRSIGSKIALSTAKRELVTLSAALNYCFRDKKLDRPGDNRNAANCRRVNHRFLARQELARLLLGALGWDLFCWNLFSICWPMHLAGLDAQVRDTRERRPPGPPMTLRNMRD
jgi:hypothetical protein